MASPNWPTGSVCQKCLGEGQIVGRVAPDEDRLLDCPQCDGKGYIERAINPPICPGCLQPVPDTATNPLGGSVWHGTCYAQHAAQAWANYQQTGGVGAYSHDERVTDGLEQP